MTSSSANIVCSIAAPLRTPRDVVIDEIVRPIVKKHKRAFKDIIGQSSRPADVACRCECMFEVHRQMRWSLAKVGRVFGRDHTAVLYSIGRHLDTIDRADLYPNATAYFRNNRERGRRRSKARSAQRQLEVRGERKPRRKLISYAGSYR